jgi:O-antigen ligase
LRKAALYLGFASAVTILFSIAASAILLGLALVALLLSDAPLRLPRIWLPLSLFLGMTLVSLAASGDIAGGLPQVRKIFVYSILLVVFSLFRSLRVMRWLFVAWAGVGALVATRGLVQFSAKVAEARALGRDFYDYYEPERITGFMSHWMTFSGQLMFVVLMLAAFLFWSPAARKRLYGFGVLCLLVSGAALVAGYTRNIWIATAGAGVYLVFNWKRRVVALIPGAAAVLLLAGGDALRERALSIFNVGTNQVRIVMWRTGLEMVKAHPLLGVGPEQIKKQEVFAAYIPADIPRPLPDGWYGHLHNFYLHYAAERGIPAALLLVWMLGMCLTDFHRALRALPPGRGERRFLLHGALAVVMATMISGFFEHNLGDSEVLTMFLTVVGCGYVAVEEKEPAGA